MTKAEKERISKALSDYTAKITVSPQAAKDALESEGIYDGSGQISKDYRAPATA